MDIWNADKLMLFLAFVIPGFVSLKTYELIALAAPQDASKQVIDAMAYSSFNYALLLWPIYALETYNVRTSYPTLYIVFYVFAFLLAPIGWATGLWKLRETEFFQKTLPHPTGKPWDYLFKQRKRYWVIVTLQDGRQIAGRYDSKSFASSAPEAEQLYLEQVWKLGADGGFERARVESAGVLILSAHIASVELFNIVDQGSQDGNKSEGRDGKEGVATLAISSAKPDA